MRVRFHIGTFITVVILFAASFTASGQRVARGAIHNIPDSAKLVHQIAFLSDTKVMEGRGCGTGGATQAAFWIAGQFAKSGLTQFKGGWFQHFFPGQGKVGHNVIGMIPGSVKDPRDSYIVIGAHYDHLGKTDDKVFPGADSNASGVASLVNLVHMMATMKILGRVYKSSVIVVAFDAKELSLAGSAAFWKALEDRTLVDPLTGQAVTADRIRLMVNLDQIGSSLSPLPSGRRDYLLMLGNESLPKDSRSVASYVNDAYGTDLELCFDYYGSKRFTELFYRKLADQKPFVQHGKPSVLFTSGITMNNNKVTDTVETLDIGVLRRRIIFIYHWLDRMI